MRNILEKLHLIAHSEKGGHIFEVTHGSAHLAYFGAVFVEGHGMYATMGGVLLALGIVAFLFGKAE